MDPTLKAVLLLLFGSAVGYGFSRLGRNRDRKTDKVLSNELVAIEAVKNRDNRITELERTVAQLEERAASRDKAAIPIEAAMQAMLIHKLTNPHTREADALLKKLTDRTLTVNDAARFAKAMLDRQTDMGVSEAQRLAARILPDMIRLRELAEQESIGEVKTVMVTVPKTETVLAEDGGTQEEETGN